MIKIVKNVTKNVQLFFIKCCCSNWLQLVICGLMFLYIYYNKGITGIISLIIRHKSKLNLLNFLYVELRNFQLIISKKQMLNWLFLQVFNTL